MYAVTKFSFDGRNNNSTNATEAKILRYESFREFAESFSKCIQGHKFQEYWVRGELGPGTDKNGVEHDIYRKDASLSVSKLLVIDGDSSSGTFPGAPPITDLMEILKELKLEHFIYTSHSHTMDKTKFRCVIPCEDMVKAQLKEAMLHLIAVLNSMGYPIDYVKEMGTWSQPWFSPTRDDPEDGLFEFHYNAGEVLELQFEAPKDVVVEKVEDITESKTIQEHLKDISQGHYHQAIIAISYGKAKDGITKGQNLAEMQAFMMLAPNQDDRWQERYNDLERTVGGAYDRLESSEEIDDYGLIYRETSNGELPWPPGALGELADLAMAQANFPHKEAAFVSALGLVAGIAGRKFNVNSRRGLGLNMYFMLAAPTGAGKDSIQNFIIDNIPIPEGGHASSFIGPSNFTAATGLIKNYLKDARCMISVMGEMGYVLSSEAGDKAGKRRALLELYTKSGHRDVLQGTAFSDSDKSVPSINSPAFSVIGESTPTVLIESIVKDDSVKDGWLPRFSVFRIMKINTVPNRTFTEANQDMKDRIADLAETCSQIQNQSTFECFLLNMYDLDEMIDHETYWRQITVDIAEESQLKSAMASRLHAKALKYAGIATVFNKRKGDVGCLTIDKVEWEWAKAMVNYEYETISNFFQGAMSGSPLDSACSRVFGKYIIMAISGDKSQKKIYNNMDPAMRKDKAVSVSVLRQVIANKLSKYNSSYKDGFDIVLEYMLTQGYVTRKKDYTNAYMARTKDVLIVKQSYFDRLKIDYTTT